MSSKPTWDRAMFDLGIKETGVNPVGEWPSGGKYGGNQYVVMKCGCVGDAIQCITKNSHSSWHWNGTDFWSIGWCGCGIHLYDENGQMEDCDELMTANVEGIARIMQQRLNRLN